MWLPLFAAGVRAVVFVYLSTLLLLYSTRGGVFIMLRWPILGFLRGIPKRGGVLLLLPDITVLLPSSS